MGEVVVWSLLVGTLGIQAATLGSWLRWQQTITEQQREEEEETLTPYESRDTVTSQLRSSNGNQGNGSPRTSQGTNGSGRQPNRDPRLTGWEFKIVRANRELFRDPTHFKRLCDEEAQAGWILLEKLDDRRIRFKRPIALRDIIKTDYLTIDPYRSHYGSSSRPGLWIGAIAALTAILLPAYLGYVLVMMTLNKSQASSAPGASFPLTSPTWPSPSVPPSLPPSPTQE